MLASLKTADSRTIHADLHPSYPHAKHFAAEVRDDSMSAAGIADGMFAVCVDLATARLTVESGKIYAIRRSVDGGRHWETTIRKAMVYSDRTEYRAESDQSDHPVITVPAGSQMDGQEAKVEPIGLAFSVLRFLY